MKEFFYRCCIFFGVLIVALWWINMHRLLPSITIKHTIDMDYEKNIKISHNHSINQGYFDKSPVKLHITTHEEK